jgi:hypothetical protein
VGSVEGRESFIVDDPDQRESRRKEAKTVGVSLSECLSF